MDRPGKNDFLIIPKKKRRILKASLLPLFVLCFVFGIACSPSAKETLPKRSWWIEGKFSSSSHGRLSCSECHSNIEEKGVKHPDPKLLGRESPFFTITKNVRSVIPRNTNVT
jgi:hypothetical protein